MKDPTPDNLTLDEIQNRFSTDLKARIYLESIIWPKGPVCPHCKNTQNIWKIEPDKKKKIREGLYQCSACKKQFTVTVGTVFEDSKIPLRKWLVAFYLLSSSKKGIAALQIQRMLGLGSYRTAHFMMHRIRHAIAATSFEKPLEGVIECDETYLGGQPRSYTENGKLLSKVSTKIPVVSMVERGGNKRSFVFKRINSKNLIEAITEHTALFSTIVTDEAAMYTHLRHFHRTATHHSISHKKKQYSLKLDSGFTVHTNTVESSFALLKRGIIGTFHSIGEQYLPLYLAEFDHRWNHRKITDGKRTLAGIEMVKGKRLIYGKPKGKKTATLTSNGTGKEQI